MKMKMFFWKFILLRLYPIDPQESRAFVGSFGQALPFLTQGRWAAMPRGGQPWPLGAAAAQRQSSSWASQ